MEWLSNDDLSTLMHERVRARIRLGQLQEEPERLYQFIQTHFVPCCYELIPQFDGVFAANELPPHSDKDTMFIMNSDNRSQEGTHWMAYFQRNGHGEFFDSFGRSPCTYTNLEPWFASSPIPIDWVHRRIQGPDNGLCGNYCIYYLMERPLHPEGTLIDFLFERPRFTDISPRDAKDMTRADLKSLLGFNDAFVVSYVKHNIRLLTK